MGLIELTDIHKVYDMGAEKVRALNGVDLVVERGEYVAIMGSSGSGKSTLMNLLGCLDTPSSGSYHLNGVAVEELDDTQLAGIRNKEIGFVFQSFHLLPRTSALENVELPMLYDRRVDRRDNGIRKRDTKAFAAAALERVGLGNRAEHQPSELSGGQQQRVAIARALVIKPQLAVCDEPTSALDHENGKRVMEMLQKMASEEKTTLVVVTHDARIFGYADRIAKMNDGRIVEVVESAAQAA